MGGLGHPLGGLGHPWEEVETAYYDHCQKHYWIRHSESESNVGYDMVHPDFTHKWIDQSKDLCSRASTLEAAIVVVVILAEIRAG